MSTAKKEPRLVQIGLNLISLLDVNDKEHSFIGNVLMVRFSFYLCKAVLLK